MSTSREELERKLAPTRRLAAAVADRAIKERLAEFIDEIGGKLRELNQSLSGGELVRLLPAALAMATS